MDISVVICGHNEGRLLQRTLRSIFAAIDYALTQDNNLKIEIILSLDTPDRATENYLEISEYLKKISVYRNDFEDAALSRNFAVQKAEGKYIAFIDGDDLMCVNWLYDAYKLANKSKEGCIYHPEYLINFEGKSLIWKRLSSTDPNFRYGTMFYANCWDLTCFLPKDIALKYPFVYCPKDSGWGMEDYHFFLETLGNGINHVVIPQTIVFIRVKSTGSRLSQHVNSYAVVRKNKLFEPRILEELCKDKEISHAKKTDKKTFYEKIVNIKHRLLEPYPELHLFLYRIKLHFLRRNRRAFSKFIRRKYPTWLLEEWEHMNAIEPSVFPSIQTLLEIHTYNLQQSDALARNYINLHNLIGKNVTHLILVPFIKVGGAEKVLFNFISSLKRHYPKERIVVVSTEPYNSPWKDRLPQDVPFVDLGNMKDVSYENKELILRRLLIQLAPKHVYNLSSQLAFIIFNKYGKALAQNSKLYVFAFCQEYDQEGKLQGYTFLYLDRCFDYLTKVFTDNQRYIDLLCNIYGFSKDKFAPLYQPAEVLDISKKKYHTNGELHLLWASRLDRQKHPEIIYEVAKNCLALPVHIDVYGTKVLDKYFIPEKYRLPNIEYKGTFSNGLKEIASDYDGFIYTSEYDGMPNIILEAIGVGLPIISSNVGGIGDLLEDKKSVLFVNEFNDVDGYRKNIEYALKHRKEFNEYAKVAQKEMQKKHNWKTLEETIKNNLK